MGQNRHNHFDMSYLQAVMCPCHFCRVRVTSPSSQRESESSKNFRVDSETSHDFIESERVTTTVESLRGICLQAQVNVESNEISHFSMTFLF